jgi:hypothetical protein
VFVSFSVFVIIVRVCENGKWKEMAVELRVNKYLGELLSRCFRFVFSNVNIR